MTTPDKLSKLSYNRENLLRHHNEYLLRCQHLQNKTLKIPRVALHRNLNTVIDLTKNQNERNTNYEKQNFDNFIACSDHKTNPHYAMRTTNSQSLLTATNIANLHYNSVNLMCSSKGPTTLPIESIIHLPYCDNFIGTSGKDKYVDRGADSHSIASSTQFTMVNGFGPMEKNLPNSSACCCCCKCKPIAAIIITMTFLLIILILVAIFSIELPRMMRSHNY